MPGSIEHVVIIVKENHTFDNYFGSFPKANGAPKLKPAPNPPPWDPPHRHENWEARLNNRKYKLQYSGKKDIPGYWKLASTYTLCDNYFSEVAGPSTPNHVMLICADAPLINNPKHYGHHPTPDSLYDLRSLPKALEGAHKTWANYGGYAFDLIKELAGHTNNYPRDSFLRHAKAGKLAHVSWVYGDGRPDLSEHPKQNVTDGMRWTLEQINAVVDGGYWGKVAIFVTWDDWGGWYDHVTPPCKEEWNSKKAQHPSDAHPEFNGQQFRFGSRVPCLVLSPYAKPKYISHQENSHVSLVKFCETTFGLHPLTDKDGASNGMSDCFDLRQSPLPAPR